MRRIGLLFILLSGHTDCITGLVKYYDNNCLTLESQTDTLSRLFSSNADVLRFGFKVKVCIKNTIMLFYIFLYSARNTLSYFIWSGFIWYLLTKRVRELPMKALMKILMILSLQWTYFASFIKLVKSYDWPYFNYYLYQSMSTSYDQQTLLIRPVWSRPFKPALEVAERVRAVVICLFSRRLIWPSIYSTFEKSLSKISLMDLFSCHSRRLK